MNLCLWFFASSSFSCCCFSLGFVYFWFILIIDYTIIIVINITSYIFFARKNSKLLFVFFFGFGLFVCLAQIGVCAFFLLYNHQKFHRTLSQCLCLCLSIHISRQDKIIHKLNYTATVDTLCYCYRWAHRVQKYWAIVETVHLNFVRCIVCSVWALFFFMNQRENSNSNLKFGNARCHFRSFTALWILCMLTRNSCS